MRVIWLDVRMFECPVGARVVVVGVASRGGLRWWRGTRVVVVRCVLLAETAVGRSKNIVEKEAQELDSALWIAALERSL